MKCPKCGYMRQARDDAFVPASECPSCGIVYSKHDTIAAPMVSPMSATQPSHLRPSAVDPESLKKARERVEKRLRERMESRTRDDRYEQTLELAKQITNDTIHTDKDPVLQALEQRMAAKPLDPADDPDVDTEDPVLLEEMVGVQLHSGKDGEEGDEDASEAKGQPVVDTPAESSVAPDADPAEDEIHIVEADAGGTEAVDMEPDAVDEEVTDPPAHESAAEETEPVASEPETAEEMVSETVETQSQTAGLQDQTDADYPDDVRVETVVLTSQLDATETPEQADLAPEPPADVVATDEDDVELPEAYVAAASNATRFGANLTRLLPMVAWLILVTGLVGAVLSWTTISEVEAGVNIPMSSQHGTVLPLGLLLGFAYLATGALGFAFFWVSSMINRQLKDIREILQVHPGASDTQMLASNKTE